MENYTTSPDIKEKVKHFQNYIKQMEALEIGESIAIPTSDINDYTVNALCEALTEPGKQVFVHTRHRSAFEVARIDSNFKRQLFYLSKDSKSNQTEEEIVGSCVEKLQNFINDFEFRTVEEVNKTAPFDEKMKVNKIIPYAYMQRCLISAAPFKHYSKGATQALKMGLRVLGEQGIVEPVDSETAKEDFGTKVRLYRIV